MYNEILENLKEYFANLIIIQYRMSEKNRRTIKMLVDIVFANNLALKIRDLCVDVDKSVGKQLDVVGRWVGLDRFYDGTEIPDRPYFANINWSKPATPFQGGFSTWRNFSYLKGATLTWRRIREVALSSNQMGDTIFRTLIKLKIIKNSIKFTNKNIDEAIHRWSDGKVYTAWDKMKVTYYYPAEMGTIMYLARYKNCLLAPTGCEIEMVNYQEQTTT